MPSPIHSRAQLDDDTTPHPTEEESPVSEPESRAAAERVAAELSQVADDAIRKPSVKLSAAVSMALALCVELEPYSERIAELPHVDVVAIGKLRDYALALYYWHSSAVYPRARRSPVLSALVQKGLVIRKRLLDGLRPFVSDGFIDAAVFTEFGGNAAHHKVALDLTGLANLMREHWSHVQGHSLLTLADADEAARLADTIMQSVDPRKKTKLPPPIAEARRQRDRACTLFVHAYDEARRAISFLRWRERDANKIFPPLHSAGRRARRKKATPATPTPAPQAS